MALRQKRLLRGLGSLLLTIAAILAFQVSPPGRVSPVFFSEERGFVTIDFSGCSSEKQGASITYGSATYQLTKTSVGICVMQYASVQEDRDWRDGDYTTTCLVPQYVGVQNLIIRGYGVDLQPIREYCASNTGLKTLLYVVPLATVIIFCILSLIARFAQFIGQILLKRKMRIAQ